MFTYKKPKKKSIPTQHLYIFNCGLKENITREGIINFFGTNGEVIFAEIQENKVSFSYSLLIDLLIYYLIHFNLLILFNF